MTGPEESRRQMVAMARMLAAKSFPAVPPAQEEEIAVLKQRVTVLDGYEVTVYYGECDYPGGVRMRTVQVYSSDFAYLPFRVVCRVGRLFLGDVEPGLVKLSSPHHSPGGVRQVYVWVTGHPMVGVTRAVYEGFAYRVMTDDGMLFL